MFFKFFRGSFGRTFALEAGKEEGGDRCWLQPLFISGFNICGDLEAFTINEYRMIVGVCKECTQRDPKSRCCHNSILRSDNHCRLLASA